MAGTLLFIALFNWVICWCVWEVRLLCWTLMYDPIPNYIFWLSSIFSTLLMIGPIIIWNNQLLVLFFRQLMCKTHRYVIYCNTNCNLYFLTSASGSSQQYSCMSLQHYGVLNSDVYWPGANAGLCVAVGFRTPKLTGPKPRKWKFYAAEFDVLYSYKFIPVRI